MKTSQASNDDSLDYDITPLGMLSNAQTWHIVYRQNIRLNTEHQLIAIYCLLIGFEMLLKAYLMFLNKSYCKHSKLITLRHDFSKILNAIKKEPKADLLVQIENVIDQYRLNLINIDQMRYPKKGDSFLFHPSYYQIPNHFDLLFDSIGSRIQAGVMNAFYKK